MNLRVAYRSIPYTATRRKSHDTIDKEESSPLVAINIHYICPAMCNLRFYGRLDKTI